MFKEIKYFWLPQNLIFAMNINNCTWNIGFYVVVDLFSREQAVEKV